MLGELLKEYRERRGYTMKYMAEQLGLSAYQGYQRLEAVKSGPVRVPMKYLPMLREILDIPLEQYWCALSDDIDVLYEDK